MGTPRGKIQKKEVPLFENRRIPPNVHIHRHKLSKNLSRKMNLLLAHLLRHLQGRLRNTSDQGVGERPGLGFFSFSTSPAHIRPCLLSSSDFQKSVCTCFIYLFTSSSSVSESWTTTKSQERKRERNLATCATLYCVSCSDHFQKAITNLAPWTSTEQLHGTSSDQASSECLRPLVKRLHLTACSWPQNRICSFL